MKIIPVLDLLNGKVVHGIAGERRKYQPISHSVISDSADPLIVAEKFAEKLGVKNFYLADLNLIQRTPNKNCNEKIIQILGQKSDYELLVDAGIQTIKEALTLHRLGVNQIILGTETIRSFEVIEKLITVLGEEKLVVSIDLRDGKIVATNDELRRVSVAKLFDKIEPLALHAVIVLELRKVGKSEGPISQSLLEILETEPKTPIYVGGGIRTIEDVLELEKQGAKGCLIATAFHRGAITQQDLMKIH